MLDSVGIFRDKLCPERNTMSKYILKIYVGQSESALTTIPLAEEVQTIQEACNAAKAYIYALGGEEVRIVIGEVVGERHA